MGEAELSVPAIGKPTRRGVIDSAFTWVEQLPGTAVPWIIGGSIALAFVAHAATWLAGETPFGEPRPELLFPIPFLAFFLLLIVALDAVAHDSFDAFRPALDQPADVVDRLRADLTSIPDVAGGITIAIWALLTFLGQDPANAYGGPPVTGLILGVLWFLTNSALALLVVHTLRQLRQVGRLQALAVQVDLLDPAPINAFSRLTAATAGGILTVGVLFALVDAGDPTPAGIVAEIVIAVIAGAFFVLPLRGMHGRLAAEKGRLLGNANARLRAVIDQIHEMIDTRDLDRADALEKAQAALLAERELYLKLSTWPWSTSTFRGVLSAVMLPIFIGIVLRVISRFI